MSTEIADAYIALHTKMEGVEQDITKGLGGPVESAGKKAGSGFASAFKGAVGPLAAILGGAAIAKGVSDFVTESIASLTRIDKINTQTASVIESTGGAANVSAAHVEALAGSLEGLTATEAESIQEGANMLLTFKNIQNGVGDGNDIFDQATAALTDMSRAMGQDPATAAVQLGKALNDPIAGISALSRVGIQFTDDQKGLIQSLVDSGQTMEAQKIILGELNSQFGGSGAAYAESYAGRIDLLGHAWGTFGETLLQGVMPVLGGAVGFLTDVTNAATGVVTILTTGDFDSGLFAAFGVQEDSGFVDFLFNVRDGLGGLGETFGPVIGQLAELWMQFSPLSVVLQALQPMLPMIAVAFGQVAQILGGTLMSILTTLTPLFVQIAGLIGDLAAQVIPMILPIIVQLATLFGTVLEAVMPLVTVLISALMPIFEALIPVIITILNAFLPLVSVLVDALAPILTLVAEIAAQILVPILNTVVGVIQWLAQIVQWAVTNVIAPLFTGIVVPAVQLVGNIFTSVFGGLGDWFEGIWKTIERGFKGFINFIIDGINGFIGGLNEVGNFVSDVTGGSIDFSIGKLPRLAEGGLVPRTPGGIPAIIGEGRYDEVVLPLSPEILGALGGGAGVREGQVLYLVLDDGTQLKTYVRGQAAGVVESESERKAVAYAGGRASA